MILGIYGSGGLGREVLELARQINAITNKWNDIIFINDYLPESKKDGFSFYPSSAIFEKYKPDTLEIVIAMGEPSDRRLIYDKVKDKGYNSPILIHPNTNIANSVEILSGTTICYSAHLSCDVFIGANAYIQPHALIGHDSIIGEHTVISPGVCIAGRCSIGHGSYIGMGAMIKEDITIGSDTIIGIGSVVYNDIPDNVIAMGNPARIIKNNDEKKVFR